MQFFTGKTLQHRRFGQKALVGKQVEFEGAARRLVDLAPDECQLVVVFGRDFAFQHRLAQVLRRSRPAVRVFPHVTLTLMIVGGRQRLQLVEGDLVVGQCIEQHRRHRCQTQTALNVARAEPQQIADLCRSLPVRRQVAERRDLIGRVHLLALAVLHHRHHARHRPADDQHLDRVIVGHDAVRGGLVGVVLLFHQPAQRQRAALTGGNAVAAILHLEHDQIHQQTGRADGSGQPLDRRLRGFFLAHVQVSQHQLAERGGFAHSLGQRRLDFFRERAFLGGFGRTGCLALGWCFRLSHRHGVAPSSYCLLSQRQKLTLPRWR